MLSLLVMLTDTQTQQTIGIPEFVRKLNLVNREKLTYLFSYIFIESHFNKLVNLITERLGSFSCYQLSGRRRSSRWTTRWCWTWFPRRSGHRRRNCGFGAIAKVFLGFWNDICQSVGQFLTIFRSVLVHRFVVLFGACESTSHCGFGHFVAGTIRTNVAC